MPITITSEDTTRFDELFQLCPAGGERIVLLHDDGARAGYGVRRPDGTGVFLHVNPRKPGEAFTLHWIDGPLARG